MTKEELVAEQKRLFNIPYADRREFKYEGLGFYTYLTTVNEKLDEFRLQERRENAVKKHGMTLDEANAKLAEYVEAASQNLSKAEELAKDFGLVFNIRDDRFDGENEYSGYDIWDSSSLNC